MKLLLVGSNKEWAIENAYLDAFSKLCDAKLNNMHGRFIDFYKKSILNKILFRCGFSSIYKQLNQSLLEDVDNFQPDAILVFKGMEIFPQTLEKLKDKKILLYNYNPDHPFRFHSKGSGNQNVKDSIHLYDHHFCYSKTILEELKTTYKIKSGSWLPFGYVEARMPKNQENEFIRKVCFIGNPDKERMDIISKICQAGIPIDVYGVGWKQHLPKDEKVGVFGPIYNDDFYRIAPSYAAQLNFFRPHNKNSHNMRTFEMPSLGCIMLAPKSREHELLFEHRKEAFFFSSIDELINLSKEILAMDEKQLDTVKYNAYQRSINEDYSYKARAQSVR